MKEDPLKEKSLAFAVEIVKAAKRLRDERREFALSDQLLRSGTSIGANLAEARSAASRKDFLAKCKISQKECAETSFWLQLLARCELLPEDQIRSLSDACAELRRMLSATCTTLEAHEGK
ncbi:MAG: four helix bundle protein [Kiritimatiellae bacterium]|nr:four helix bundle protein [Kiritimatiellia bacterium]